MHVPCIDLGIDTPAQAAIACMVELYVIAAGFNLRIPRTDTAMEPLTGKAIDLVRDFSQCNARLWDDKLGQISLATTTLFWGVSRNLQYVVLAWAGVALSYDTPQATLLGGGGPSAPRPARCWRRCRPGSIARPRHRAGRGDGAARPP